MLSRKQITPDTEVIWPWCSHESLLDLTEAMASQIAAAVLQRSVLPKPKVMEVNSDLDSRTA